MGNKMLWLQKGMIEHYSVVEIFSIMLVVKKKKKAYFLHAHYTLKLPIKKIIKPTTTWFLAKNTLNSFTE